MGGHQREEGLRNNELVRGGALREERKSNPVAARESKGKNLTFAANYRRVQGPRGNLTESSRLKSGCGKGEET